MRDNDRSIYKSKEFTLYPRAEPRFETSLSIYNLFIETIQVSPNTISLLDTNASVGDLRCNKLACGVLDVSRRILAKGRRNFAYIATPAARAGDGMRRRLRSSLEFELKGN
ncbi:hypothetical protein EVAR_55805_1 [Eumeta japonica]|uniref:Uncharacterized protein n=1 Tax=Eumeta variegata TaxID=151549 RepID=A0A4C1YTP2_EUMVA|nr:hypothetical protein EVAR_55805_1 [Eumeta japonica]